MGPVNRHRAGRPSQARRICLALSLLSAVALSRLAFVPAPPTLKSARSRALVSESRSERENVRQAGPELLTPALLTLLASSPAHAEEANAFAEVPSALVAYGHYLALIVSTGALVTERLTIKPGMTKEEEERLAFADAVYGVSGLLVLITGYLRVTSYGKGWEFYQHEPIFWVKLVLVAVAGASSLFPTITIVRRALARKDAGDAGIAPISSKLAARMTSIVNAELLAIASIPLTATLMARGVGYLDWLPWQAGAAPVVLAAGGLGFKYVKEVLDWKEDAE
eukprot:gb/GFBE01023329.1/.p1 GENE.gb/GFBE01023329.1/~~gb/GFBE01023329.1/.p1  ORF type:complete len:281 (+),score=53.76 gb/GFBE01023329.1/:1-843(+)